MATDLAITKTDGNTSVVPGTVDTYTITVSNNGPDTVSSVNLIDTIPGALSNATFGSPSQGSYDPVSGLWSGLSLASGQSVSITLSGVIDPNATGSLTNVVTVSPPAGVTDTNTANNTASDTDTFTPVADLAITKTDGNTSVVPGTSDTYTIVVSNQGPSAVIGASVSDPLPAGVTAATWAATGSSGGGIVSGPTSGTGALATTVDLPVNASVTYEFTVQVSPSATGSLTNTATVSPPAGVTDANPANNTASDTDTIPTADLSITKTDGNTSVVPGTSDTYTIVVTNNGPDTVSSVNLIDTIPGALSNATFGSPSQGSYDPVSGLWSGLSLASGQSVSITLSGVIDPNATGSLTNVVTVSPPAGVTDTNTANNTASDTDTLTPVADLSITKTDGNTSVVPGTSDTYTIVVSNQGPSAVIGASVSDPLPAGVTAATWAATGSSGGGIVSGPTSGTGALATTVDLPVNASVTYEFTVQVSPSATGSLTNVVTVSPPAGVTDANPANNTASDTDTLTLFGGVNLVKLVNGQDADSPTGPHVAAGSTLTFTYVVTDTGDVPLANVVVTDDKLGPITSFTGDTNANGLLDLTETWTYTQTATALAGQQTNVGTVTGQDVNTLTTVTDDNPANYFGDAPALPPPTSDFDADNKSDLLWQGDNGTAAMWLMDGTNTTFVGAAGPFNPGPSWEIKGTGDFNGDGKSDIIWQGDDGTAAMWLMDGTNTTFAGAVGPFNPGPSWEIKGTGDFNGDGKSDIIWQGDDGTAAMWLMDGTNTTFVGAVGPFNPGHELGDQGNGRFQRRW